MSFWKLIAYFLCSYNLCDFDDYCRGGLVEGIIKSPFCPYFLDFVYLFVVSYFVKSFLGIAERMI